jgi:hypothetical protein
LESAFGTTLGRSDVVVPFLQSHGDDSSRSNAEWRARFQSLRLLWCVAPGKRDAVRRMRAEAQQATRATVLTKSPGERAS